VRSVVGACTAAMVLLAVVTPAGALGGWAIIKSPNRGTDVNSLTGVSCPAESCVAVGFSYSTQLAAYQTLIESEHDGRWSIVPSPNNGTSDNNLAGVSCASTRRCMAVGFYTASGVNRTLTESWDGKRWSIVPSPNPGTLNSVLQGVSCASAVSCQAVGWSYDPSQDFAPTLTESWDGTRWTIVPSPNAGPNENILTSVSCTSPRSCQAVGDYASAQGVLQTLIETWNGADWSIVPSPNNGAFGNDLRGVSCVSARSCQAVGEYGNASLVTNQSLIETWNGVSWSIVASPDIGTKVNVLDAVSCRSHDSCQAVGGYFNASLDDYQTLAESWDGRTWSIVPSPDNGTAYNVLDAVYCRPRHKACTAVGNYFNSSLSTIQTLIESTRRVGRDSGE
jgi:hypothetical protein